MQELHDLAQALLASLMVIGAAALHMVALCLVISSAMVVLVLLRWAGMVIWNAAVREWRKNRHG